MADPENGQNAPQAKRPPTGVPIYAIESLVLSVVELAWLAIPLSTGITITADQLLLLPLAAGGIINVVLCSLLSDNRIALGAFASFAITCGLGYAFVFFEAMATNRYAQVYFGGTALLQILGAVTLAFMAMHSLLALAAVHDRLWAQTAWMEGTLCLLPCLLSVVCWKSGDTAAASLNILLPCLFFGTTAATAFIRNNRVLTFIFINWRVLFVLNRVLALCTVIVALSTAYAGGLTQWALLVLTSTLLLLFTCRSVGEWGYKMELRRMGSELQQVVQNPPPADEAQPLNMRSIYPPHPLQHRTVPPHMFFSHPALQQTNLAAEAALFGGHNRLLRQQSKKRI